MSTAELNELRKEVKEYIDHADEKIVKMVHAMLEVDSDLALEQSIDRGLEQSKKRNVVPNEQVMPEIRKRYKA